MTRRKVWAIPVLIAVALTATACSKATGSGTQAGGAYGAQATDMGASSMPATTPRPVPSRRPP